MGEISTPGEPGPTVDELRLEADSVGLPFPDPALTPTARSDPVLCKPKYPGPPRLARESGWFVAYREPVGRGCATPAEGVSGGPDQANRRPGGQPLPTIQADMVGLLPLWPKPGGPHRAARCRGGKHAAR